MTLPAKAEALTPEELTALEMPSIKERTKAAAKLRLKDSMIDPMSTFRNELEDTRAVAIREVDALNIQIERLEAAKLSQTRIIAGCDAALVATAGNGETQEDRS